MFGALSLDLFAVLFGGAVAMIPVFAKDILKLNKLLKEIKNEEWKIKINPRQRINDMTLTGNIKKKNLEEENEYLILNKKVYLYWKFTQVFYQHLHHEHIHWSPHFGFKFRELLEYKSD